MAEKGKFAYEIMSDDELDGVSGGNCYQIADDSRFLNSLNGSTDRYGATKSFFNAASIIKETEAAWASLGIKCKSRGGTGETYNEYYLNGQQITQEQARQHAMKVTGHYMTESDWKW